MRSFPPVLLCCALISVLTACGGDGRPAGTAGNDSALVGGPCMNNSECELLLCQSDRAFPAGTCTSSCASSGNCPSGSSCAELDFGWVCAVNCGSDDDCRTDYSCTNAVEAGTNRGRSVAVCLGPGA